MEIELKVIDFEAIRLIGKKITIQQGKNAREHLKSFLKNGYNDFLQNLPGRISPSGDTICYMGNYNPINKSFIEMPCIFAKLGTEVPDGYDFIDLPSCKMGICAISGDSRALDRGAHNKTLKELAKNGYMADYSYGFSMEYYSFLDFVVDRSKKNPMFIFYYYLPCKDIK